MINSINDIDKILLEFNLENYNNQYIDDIINYILVENSTVSSLITEIPEIISSKKIFDGQFDYSFDPILNESNILLVELVQPIIEKVIPSHIYRSFTNLHINHITSEILNIDISDVININEIKEKIAEAFLSGNITIPVQSLRTELITDNTVKHGLFAPSLFKLVKLDKLSTAKTINDLVYSLDTDIYKINIISKLLQIKKDSIC